MRNCFPPLPRPENGVHHHPVDEEYEELTMNEIMNGKVVPCPFSHLIMLLNKILDGRAPNSLGCLLSSTHTLIPSILTMLK